MTLTKRERSILSGGDRRSFLARAMPLSPIGDIGVASLTEDTTETITWSTATDWQNSVDEAGVIHEDGNSAYSAPGSDVVTLGYPSFTQTNFEAYYPGHEDAGAGILNDLAQNDHDLTTQEGDPTAQQQNGGHIHNRGTWYYDGVDDAFSTTSIPFKPDANDWTIECWVYITDDGSREAIWEWSESGTNEWLGLGTQEDAGDHTFKVYSNGKTTQSGSITLTAPFLAYLAVTYDVSANTLEIWINGQSDYTDDIDSTGFLSNVDTFRIGGSASNNLGEWTQGNVAETRVWSDIRTQSEIQAYGDAGTSGFLTTDTKSFSGTTQPNLQNLVYSLNDGSVDLDVIGSPGTASEEIVTQSLGGATSYSLTWSSGHTDFRVKPNISTTNETDSPPTVSTVELVSP